MTKEEFSNKVKEGFLTRMSAWDSETTQDFINGEEATDVILQEYKYNVEVYNKGETMLSEESFWASVVSSTIQCLTLLL